MAAMATLLPYLKATPRLKREVALCQFLAFLPTSRCLLVQLLAGHCLEWQLHDQVNLQSSLGPVECTQLSQDQDRSVATGNSFGYTNADDLGSGIASTRISNKGTVGVSTDITVH